MRIAVIVGVVAALTVPSAATANSGFALTSTFGSANASAGHLVPHLSLGRENVFDTSGSGAGGTDNPVLALVLGIIPGFGLGHYVAGSPRWSSWLLIDVLVLAGAIVLTTIDVGVLTALTWIAFVVERVIEGLDAYHAAGGGRLAARNGPDDRSRAGSRPESSRQSAAVAALDAAVPVAVLRF